MNESLISQRKREGETEKESGGEGERGRGGERKRERKKSPYLLKPTKLSALQTDTHYSN